MSENADDQAPFSEEGTRAGAIARFHSGLAHDLNNRLTTILGYMLLFDSLYPDEKDALRDMRHAAEEAANLVRLIQTFTKRDPLPPHPFPVNDTLIRMQDLLQRLFGESRRLSVLLSEPALYVEGDEGAFERLIAELIGRMTGKDDVCLSVFSEGHSVQIRGEGGGVLLTDDRLRRLSAHMGAELTDEPGAWLLHLKRCNLYDQPLDDTSVHGNGLRILLAEGDTRLRNYLADALCKSGFSVTSAADALELDEILKSGIEPFAAAALDPLLPGGGLAKLGGFTALPEHRVWMLPFAGWGAVREECTLPKPFRVADLSRILVSCNP